ncbi:hypothetical protein [Parasphingorhabdus cellanae]|uniref:Uncharacterized protein n=1 Tax=Parasphingorhabdus cellanae TaxID=2806553 RepID=A0ABX7T5E7_9SPHN|nr:hypothetical protein [Parasphingorhabdus cellanae]QTD56800.1 hypothetical protein J4G78_04285 [Parasphingorhabdus cellanae]
MNDTTIWQFTGLAAATAGIFLLRSSWQQRHKTPARLVFGWLCILGSIIAWSQTSGADKGSALGIIVVVVIAVLAVTVTAVQAPIRERRAARVSQNKPDQTQKPGYARAVKWWDGLLVGPIAGLSAMSVSTLLFVSNRSIGMEHTANLTVAMFAFPLVWAGLAVLSGADQNMKRKSLVLMSVGVVPLMGLTLIGR